MHEFKAVLKRELKSYFTTPIGYVFLVVFLFFLGYLTFKNGFFDARQADMRVFFSNIPLLFIFLIPATAMRLWAEERRTGSVELLLTLPITVTQAVLGKFFAAWIFVIFALALTFPMVITVTYLGNPDISLILTGYLASILMAGAFLAIGCFFSAISKDQVIALVLTASVIIFLVFAGKPSTLNHLSRYTLGEALFYIFIGWGIIIYGTLISCLMGATSYKSFAILFSIGPIIALFFLYLLGKGPEKYLSMHAAAAVIETIEQMSVIIHFESTTKGLISLKDVSYFVFVTIGFLAASAVILEERKAA